MLVINLQVVISLDLFPTYLCNYHFINTRQDDCTENIESYILNTSLDQLRLAPRIVQIMLALKLSLIFSYQPRYLSFD